jgi:hypothetical protein
LRAAGRKIFVADDETRPQRARIPRHRIGGGGRADRAIGLASQAHFCSKWPTAGRRESRSLHKTTETSERVARPSLARRRVVMSGALVMRPPPRPKMGPLLAPDRRAARTQ